MRYFCYVHSRGSTVPHMEALDSPNLDEAMARSRRLLAEHERSQSAELFAPEGRVAVITRDEGGLTPPALSLPTCW